MSSHIDETAPIPWIGLYIAVASLICTLTMVADLLHVFHSRKFWFSCKYFTLNTATMTFIAIAMKLPVNLTTKMQGGLDKFAKYSSVAFMCAMMANFMPSLGTMDNTELLLRMIALVILVVTITVDVCIQIGTGIVDPQYAVPTIIDTVFMLVLLVISVSLALNVPTSKRILEWKYNEKHELDDQQGEINVEKLTRNVRKYWIMAETGNPQFVIASSPACTAAGYISLYLFLSQLVGVNYIYRVHLFSHYKSDFKWSLGLIVVIQSIGIVVGSIAPMCRLYASTMNFEWSIQWFENEMKVFRVEKYWFQLLKDWKRSGKALQMIRRRRCKKLAHFAQNLILNICIGFQFLFVVMYKIIRLFPIYPLIFYYYFFYCLKLLKKKLPLLLKKLQRSLCAPNTSASGSQPGQDTTSQPGQDTTPHPGQDTTSQPVQDTTSHLRQDTTSQPGQDTTSQPGQDTTSQPGQDTTSHLRQDTTSQPGQDTTSHPGQDTTSRFGQDTTSQPGQDTTSQPGQDTTSQPRQDTTSHPGQDTTSQPRQDTTSQPGQDTTSHPGQDTTSQTGQDTTSQPGQDTTSHPGQDTTSHLGQDTTSHPGQDTTSQPGQDITSHPGQDTTPQPGQDTTSQPRQDIHNYVVKLQDEVEIVRIILKSISNAVDRLIKTAEKNCPMHLIPLLGKRSNDLNGVSIFKNDGISEEARCCWSLAVVTLTSMAIALMREGSSANRFLQSISEGLIYVNHVEENLNIGKNLSEARRAANQVWLDVELKKKWLGHSLRERDHKLKEPRIILSWLSNIAWAIMESEEQSQVWGFNYKFIAAKSMYKISKTILSHVGCQSHETVVEGLEVMISDILNNCLTNIPRVINNKCHTGGIEIREKSVRVAAMLLGETKEILEELKKSVVLSENRILRHQL